MLTTLKKISQSMAAAANYEQALNILVTGTKEAMLTECCSIFILENQKLVLSATDGLQQSAVGKVKVPVSEGLIGLTVQREEPLNLADAHSHPSFKAYPEVMEEEYCALLSVPIIHRKQVLGVITLQQHESRQFTESEEAFLVTLAAQVSLAIGGLQQKEKVNKPRTQVILQGLAASPGIAIAPAVVIGGQISIEQQDVVSEDADLEYHRLHLAITKTRTMLDELAQRFEQEQQEDVVSIFSALQLLLDNSSLGGEYEKEVKLGWKAETAVSRVSLRFIKQFSEMNDPYLKERANDVRELGQKVLRHLIEPNRLKMEFDKPVILVTRDADATILAEFPRQKLAGIITEFGGVNSHASIMARALGIPAVVGVNKLLLADLTDKKLILNAHRGTLLVSPSRAVVKEYQALVRAEQAQERRYRKEMSEPTVTLDGRRIKLYVNAGLLGGIKSEVVNEADGIGLYRTEIAFMLQSHFPSEIEQIKLYSEVLQSMPNRPVVMRTLDIGGDKALPYFPISEVNPFLGWRGIRLSLDHPDLLLIQLRAMMQADHGKQQLQILLPMVSHLSEIDIALQYIERAHTEIESELGKVIPKPKVGVMIEVPSLVYQLDQVAQRVDFVSVGSNDLTQYLLAVDRNNPNVSELYDSYHPGVLRALQRIMLDCRQHELEVSVCGELASEPMGAVLLLAMGCNKLSMNHGNIPKINYVLRRVSLSELKPLLRSCLLLDSGEEVRDLVHNYFSQKSIKCS
ncbi:phosphoenolpyruvate-protein phosphotransferase PtsP [Parashewanella curva]|uniref:phosphoenolpyruvate--protein phosphotransferase n=1 Tax=Parashewanella curva TaxID=2338552 RepID=A0A3L8Q216_9GAMM|nr:phosphoenolpyruvate--protein phosphotransferase [Parashewanella curva]RLV61706.1 phosphoenolpyruvate-protein phosphotransferase PtsP [Parashewanella curva]